MRLLFCPVPHNNTDLNAQTNYFWLYFSFLQYKIRETCTRLPSNDGTGYSTADCRTLGWGETEKTNRGWGEQTCEHGSPLGQPLNRPTPLQRWKVNTFRAGSKSNQLQYIFCSYCYSFHWPTYDLYQAASVEQPYCFGFHFSSAPKNDTTNTSLHKNPFTRQKAINTHTQKERPRIAI